MVRTKTLKRIDKHLRCAHDLNKGDEDTQTRKEKRGADDMPEEERLHIYEMDI
jgi:hypothetical protein